MHPKTKTILKSLTILALFALSIQALATWTNPTGVAPANNTQPPINVSLTGQDKDGALIAGGLRSDTSVIGVENALFGALDLPNTSSVLELRSITKGFLPPRMNLVQRNAIATPATGLLIYQTDNAPGFYYFDGTNWMAIGSGGNGGGGGGGGIGGSGTPNTVAKWTATGTLGDSSLTDNGTLVVAGAPLYMSSTLFVETQVIVITSSNATNFPFGNATHFEVNRLPGENVSTIQGFESSNEDGRVAYLTNQSTSITFTLKNNSSLCSPQNRLSTVSGGDITLAPRETIMMVYDAGYPGGSRWRELFKSQ
jgi:hypothetical protein